LAHSDRGAIRKILPRREGGISKRRAFQFQKEKNDLENTFLGSRGERIKAGGDPGGDPLKNSQHPRERISVMGEKKKGRRTSQFKSRQQQQEEIGEQKGLVGR